ncbi:Transcriptional regulator, GntR family [Pseudomonas sp. LBUM920]|nr:Transcriptional regulator, GntR family [Pseudomonas sp. LBUM920]
MLIAFRAGDERAVRSLMHEPMCDAEHHMTALEGEISPHCLLEFDHSKKLHRSTVKTQSMWELACLRWNRLVVPDRPRCLHRRQASSHRKAKQCGAGG